MITYNNNKLKEILSTLKKRRSDFRADIGIQNDITVKRWIEGGDIYVSRLTEICNIYNKDIIEFFLVDGQEIKPNKIQECTEPVPASDNISILLVKKDKEIAEIKLQSKEDIFSIREELHRQEIKHIKEISELTVRLREEERTRLFEQHDQNAIKSKQEIEELRNRMEQLLSAKDQENSLLQQKLNNLQLEYKELEMSVGMPGSRYKTPTAVAEPTPYTKHRP